MGEREKNDNRKKSNGKLMLCNLAPPILRGIYDHFLCKRQQGFQSFLYPMDTPDVRKYTTMIGLIGWVGFKKQLKNCQNETDSILFMEKLRTQSLWWLCISSSHSKGRSYGENKGKRTLSLEAPGGRPGGRREDRRGYKGQCWMETVDSLWPPLKATAKIRRRRCPQVALCVLWLSRCLSR